MTISCVCPAFLGLNVRIRAPFDQLFDLCSAATWGSDSRWPPGRQPADTVKGIIIIIMQYGGALRALSQRHAGSARSDDSKRPAIADSQLSAFFAVFVRMNGVGTPPRDGVLGQRHYRRAGIAGGRITRPAGLDIRRKMRSLVFLSGGQTFFEQTVDVGSPCSAVLVRGPLWAVGLRRLRPGAIRQQHTEIMTCGGGRAEEGRVRRVR